MGSNFYSLALHLNVTPEQPWFYWFIHNKKYFLFFNHLHLIKCVRNNLMKYCFKFGKYVVTWKDRYLDPLHYKATLGGGGGMTTLHQCNFISEFRKLFFTSFLTSSTGNCTADFMSSSPSGQTTKNLQHACWLQQLNFNPWQSDPPSTNVQLLDICFTNVRKNTAVHCLQEAKHNLQRSSGV